MALVLLTILVSLVYSAMGTPLTTKYFKPITPKINAPEEFQLNWAQYSPYFPVEPYKDAPHGCKVDQVCGYYTTTPLLS